MRMLTLDQARRREPFEPTKSLALYYERALRKVARHIGDLTQMMDPDGDENPQPLVDALQRYERLLTPWAETTARRMVDAANATNSREWRAHAATMGRELRREIENAPTGVAMQALQAEQVDLITSLPREAAERVQKLAREGLITGARSTSLVEEIMRSGDVAESRAICIARTETARASSVLTQVRAQAAGCTHFLWRSHRDTRTRASHRAMNGAVCEYANPPVVDGEPLMPGGIYNCRCYQVPIID